MDEHLLVIADGLEAFGRVLAACVVEESRTDRLANLRVVFHLLCPTGDDGQAESIHDLDELLPNILTAFHGSRLDEVLIAPLVLEAVHLPSLIDGQHRQMITIFVVELCPLLVSQLLLFTRAVEDILD